MISMIKQSADYFKKKWLCNFFRNVITWCLRKYFIFNWLCCFGG